MTIARILPGNEADEFYNKDYHTKQFCNGSQWIAEGAPAGSGGLNLISTQTASSSTSLQFTNLPTSYNGDVRSTARRARASSM